MIDVTTQLEKVEKLCRYMSNYAIPHIAKGKPYQTFDEWRVYQDIEPLPLSMTAEVHDLALFLEHWQELMHANLGVESCREGLSPRRVHSRPAEEKSYFIHNLWGIAIAEPPPLIKIKDPFDDKKYDRNYQYPCYKGIYFRYHQPQYDSMGEPLWILYRDFDRGIVACFNANRKRIDQCIEAFLKVETNSKYQK